jgi:hypothetical protein
MKAPCFMDLVLKFPKPQPIPSAFELHLQFSHPIRFHLSPHNPNSFGISVKIYAMNDMEEVTYAKLYLNESNTLDQSMLLKSDYESSQLYRKLGNKVRNQPSSSSSSPSSSSPVKTLKKMNRIRVVLFSTVFFALYVTANYSKEFPFCRFCNADQILFEVLMK